jgi:predicted nucleotidyltransferase component of viral defense system
LHEIFSEQVRLLVAVLPQVAKEECFALKGGTAINLFIRDLPRLSIDIDLAYIPVHGRDESLASIDAAMQRIKHNILRTIAGSQVSETLLQNTQYCIRLQIKRGDTMVKIEVTPVLRGSVHPVKVQKLSKSSEERFGSAAIGLLSFDDLYAGKICAALDRQHPRDLFDVYHLMANEGISQSLKDTFLIYLVSHNRPMSELLSPNLKDVKALYEQEFAGMTMQSVELELLLEARVSMINTIHRLLTDNDKELLLSIKQGVSRWELSAYPYAAELPAIKWKIHNLSGMSKAKRKSALEKLELVLISGYKG